LFTNHLKQKEEIKLLKIKKVANGQILKNKGLRLKNQNNNLSTS
jgi:hypothetical protein